MTNPASLLFGQRRRGGGCTLEPVDQDAEGVREHRTCGSDVRRLGGCPPPRQGKG